MTKEQLILLCGSHVGLDVLVELRTICAGDQFKLRTWKNQNSQFFFHQELISKAAQQRWYNGYLARDNDYMFMVQIKERSIGSMGIRMLEDTWDVYNIILGDPTFSKRGHMRQAILTMCSWANGLRPMRISARVLKNNPAIDWYCRSGFKVISTHADHVEVELEDVLPYDSESIRRG